MPHFPAAYKPVDVRGQRTVTNGHHLYTFACECLY
jgi:hypothetical protein